MGLNGSTTEEKIWNFLKSKGLNDYAIAGLMGNLHAESGLNPKNLQNSYEKKLEYTDETYTAAVDSGKYTNFAKDAAGYGLAQWTYHTRKAALLAYVKSIGKSVGDLEAQLGFLMKELTGDYSGVLSTIKKASSVLAASNAVLMNFERPADQSEAVQKKRAEYGQLYYDKFAAGSKNNQNGGTSNMNVSEVRKKFAARAAAYVGTKEGSAQHKAIIDRYNQHKPLARGYKVTYHDAWCATFGSEIAIEAGYTDIIPTECGCGAQIKLWQEMGRWCENDAKVPEPGDYVYYDWEDGANFATTDNKGNPDHVGIVESVNGNTFVVVEGNKNNAVGRRTMQVNGRYIRGFGVPAFEKKATASTPQPQKPAQPQQPAQNTYTVKKGDSLWGIAQSQLGDGNRYNEIKTLNGLTSNMIYAGTVLKIPGGQAAQQPTQRTYTVKKGDSLWGIAQSQLGDGSRYNEIKKLNGLTSNMIYSGTVLKLPN